jgi:hypothetical protein
MNPTARNAPNYNFPKIRFCHKGHAIVGENIRIEGRTVRCRQCTRAKEKKTQATGNLGVDLVRKIIAGVNEGMSIYRMTGWHGKTYVGNFIVPRNRLLAFCDENPRLGKWILKKTAENASKSRRGAAISRRVHVAAPALARNLNVLETIEAVVPRYLSDADRRDIIADMWTAVAEGQLLPSQVGERVRQFVTAHRKMYQTTDRWAPPSLDAPIYDDNPLPRIERVASGDGLWS